MMTHNFRTILIPTIIVRSPKILRDNNKGGVRKTLQPAPADVNEMIRIYLFTRFFGYDVRFGPLSTDSSAQLKFGHKSLPCTVPCRFPIPACPFTSVRDSSCEVSPVAAASHSACN